MYQPESLFNISKVVINTSIQHRSDINSLLLPLTVKRSLKESYLTDKLWCHEILDPCEVCINYISHKSFDQCFEVCSPDEYLTLMNWRQSYGIPDFCYENNVVIHKWYQNLNETQDIKDYEHLCRDCCLNDPCTPVICMNVTYDLVHACNLLDEIFQVTENWCSKCLTTTLFCIQDRDDWCGGIPSSIKRRYTTRVDV